MRYRAAATCSVVRRAPSSLASLCTVSQLELSLGTRRLLRSSLNYASCLGVRMMSSASQTDGDGSNVDADEVLSVSKLQAGMPLVGDTSKQAGLEELIRGRVRYARRCKGCGSWLHSNDPNEHGYVPPGIPDDFSASGRKKSKERTKRYTSRLGA